MVRTRLENDLESYLETISLMEFGVRTEKGNEISTEITRNIVRDVLTNQNEFLYFKDSKVNIKIEGFGNNKSKIGLNESRLLLFSQYQIDEGKSVLEINLINPLSHKPKLITKVENNNKILLDMNKKYHTPRFDVSRYLREKIEFIVDNNTYQTKIEIIPQITECYPRYSHSDCQNRYKALSKLKEDFNFCGGPGRYNSWFEETLSINLENEVKLMIDYTSESCWYSITTKFPKHLNFEEAKVIYHNTDDQMLKNHKGYLKKISSGGKRFHTDFRNVASIVKYINKINEVYIN